MKLKKLLIVALSVIFILSLVACGKTGDLPKFKGSSKISEEEATRIFEEITNVTVPMEIKDYSGFSAEGDENDYLDYVNKCLKNDYIDQGSTVIEGVKMTMLSYPSKNQEESVMCLVAYRDGEIIVIQFSYEYSGPSKREFVWPTAEEFDLFHVNLTKPSGEIEGFASVEDPSKNILAPYASLDIYITNKGMAEFNTFKSDLKKSGYTLGAREDGDGNTNNYMACKVVGKVEFMCDLRYMSDRGELMLTIVNNTQKVSADLGKALFDVYPTATVGFKTVGYGNFLNGDESFDDKNGKPEEEYRIGTRYEYYSYNDKYAVEFTGRREDSLMTGDPFEFFIQNGGGWLFEIGSSVAYSSNGETLEKTEYTPEDFTAKTYLSRRGISQINTYYRNVVELQKTDKTRVIVGKACAEYTGKISMNNGESVWPATFYVWEEQGIPMSYSGKKWFDDLSDYSLEVCYLDSQCIGEQFLTLSPEGKLEEYPDALVKENSTLNFDFSVDGADGYKFNANQFEYGEGGIEIECKRFDAHGVDEGEIEAFKQKVMGYGFYEGNAYGDAFELWYNLSGGDRIKMGCSYSRGDGLFSYWFFYEDNEGLPSVESGTFVSYNFNGFGEEREPFIHFLGDDLHIGYFQTEDRFSTSRYYKYSDGNYLKYYAEPGQNLEGVDCHEVLAANILSDIGSELSFDVIFSAPNGFTKTEEFSDEFGVPVTIYSDGGSRRITVWTENSLVLSDEGSGGVEIRAIYFEKGSDFVSALPEADALTAYSYNKYQYLRNNFSHNKDTFEWKMQFTSSTYGGYKAYNYDLTESAFDEYYQEITALENNGWRFIQNDNGGHSDDWSETFSFNFVMTDCRSRVAEISGFSNKYFDEFGNSSEENRITVFEYDVLTSVEEYFGAEYNAGEKQYIDYSKIDGKYEYTQNYEAIYAPGQNNEPHPSPMNHINTIIVDLGGLLVVNGSSFASFSNEISHGNIYSFGTRKVVSFNDYDLGSKNSAEYILNAFGQILMENYDVLSFIDCSISEEEIAGVACKKYDGKYIYRGQKLEITVWRATDGRNLKVRLEHPQESATRTFTVCEILSFEEGSFAEITDVNALPVIGEVYSRSEWKEEYYGYDFVPRADGFTSFSFDSNTVSFYSDNGTITFSPVTDGSLTSSSDNDFYHYFSSESYVRLGISNYSLSAGGVYSGYASIYHTVYDQYHI